MATKDFSFSSKKDDLKIRQAILAVDNDPDTELLEALLKPIRYRVLGKETEERAVLELIRKHKSGLLFLDFDLPLIGTTMIMEKVRVNNPKMKVIVLSKKLNKVQIDEARKLGVVGFLAKPITADPVKKLLSKLM